MTDREARAWLNFVHQQFKIFSDAYNKEPQLRIDTPEQADVQIDRWVRASERD